MNRSHLIIAVLTLFVMLSAGLEAQAACENPCDGARSGRAHALATPDRREGIFIRCAGSPRTKENPLGLREGHHLSLARSREFYRKQYERAQAHGVTRIVWHMLAGYSGTPNDPADHRGAAAVLGAMRMPSILIYEHFDFYEPPGPQVLALGAPRMPMLHNADVRRDGRRESDWLDVSPERTRWAIEKLGLPFEYDGPLVIDYEPYLHGWDAQRTVAAFLAVLRAARSRLPHAKIAFYGLPHVGYPSASGARTLVTAELVQPILDEVDFLAPQHYSGRLEWSIGAAQLERKKMRLSRSFNKPIVAFIGPRAVPPNKGKWIDLEAVRQRAAILRAEGAQGIILWDDPDPAVAHEQNLRQAEALKAARAATSGSRGAVWTQETRRFIMRNPRATVGVAISPFVPFSTETTDLNEYRGYEVYDHENPAHYRMMVNEIIQPLVLAGVTELWFDRGPADSFGPDIDELCAHLKERFNLHCVLYPPRANELDEPDDPDRKPTHHREESELNLVLFDAFEVAGAAERIEAWREQGVVLWSGDPKWDAALWPRSPEEGE